MRTLAFTLSTALATACVTSPASDEHDQCAPPAPMQLNFSAKVSSKLFINNIAQPGQCGAGAVLGPLGFGKLPAYLLFCAATSLGENPATPAFNPVNYRILGEAHVSWTCVAGNAAPQNLLVNPGLSNGGPEAPGINGIANGVRVAVRNGNQFGVVTSGHPNPVVEPGFLFFRFRRNPDIWNKVVGTVSCGVDGAGRPTSRIVYGLTRTAFPSHKVWSKSPSAGPAVPRLIFNAAQGNLSALWFLPPIPNP